MTLRATTPTLLLVNALLAPGKHYGVSLARDTGLNAGTLYPILARLELDYHWLSSSMEKSPLQGRPERKYYKFTQSGEREATAWMQIHAHRLERLGGGGMVPVLP